MTCEGGNPFEADRFELEEALRKVGTGGVDVGPLEVAAELGTGRLPDMMFSDLLLVVGGAEAVGNRSGRSMAGSRAGGKTKVDVGTIEAEMESSVNDLFPVFEIKSRWMPTRCSAVRLLQS